MTFFVKNPVTGGLKPGGRKLKNIALKSPSPCPSIFQLEKTKAQSTITAICIQAGSAQFQNVCFTFQNVRLAFQDVRFDRGYVMFGQWHFFPLQKYIFLAFIL